MKVLLSIFCLILTISLQQTSCYGQETDTVKTAVSFYEIIKTNGVEYIGELISDDGREVLIYTEALGKIYIPKSDIKSMKIIERKKISDLGVYRGEGPFTSRYYFTTNALPIKKGEDYALLHLYGPEVHFAVSDQLSLGVMATWIASPIGLAAKYSFKTNNDKLNFSLGTIMLHSGYFRVNGKSFFGGLHWGSVTYGNTGNNISFTAGYGYTNFNTNDFGRNFREIAGIDGLTQSPILSIAGIKQVGKKASFIFDSMIALSERYNFRGTYVGNSQGGAPDYIVTYNRGTQVSALLMPGVRFQTTDKRAFQVALSGVFQYSDIGFFYNDVVDETTQKTRSFPAPMCSWFFKF